MNSRIAAVLLSAAAFSANLPKEALRPESFTYQVPAEALRDMRDAVSLFSNDQGTLFRFYSGVSPSRPRVLRQFYAAWDTALDAIDFEALNHDGKVDWLLLRNLIASDRKRLDARERRMDEISGLVPFRLEVGSLWEARQRVDPIDPAKTAASLNRIRLDIEALTSKLPSMQVKKTTANRAAASVAELRGVLDRWYKFYDGYDPNFSWWNADPHKRLDTALQAYSTQIRDKLVGVKAGDKDTIIGDPVGRARLIEDLQAEFIPYTPEELIAIANTEFAWCEKEMLRASHDLGFGDDWKKALEHVKGLYVPPGEQANLVRNLALEAADYVSKNDLVTVPALAREMWRMDMMSAEAQKKNPFFLGGDTIIVSYPLASMSHDEKMMSMRGNNPYFSRATVHHELIPGHWLQEYMNSRYRSYREFNTPFWIEGWSLYWEMLLYERGFASSPEDRVGFLFWRMHRCARIIFSLNFHLEKMTAQECVQFLVDKVGHEKENAAGEVRRSFEGDYPPLYQIAYMMGALQFRALNHELVRSGKMNVREFHDTILKLNQMPVEMVRASLTNQKLTRDFHTSWKFAGEVKP